MRQSLEKKKHMRPQYVYPCRVLASSHSNPLSSFFLEMTYKQNLCHQVSSFVWLFIERNLWFRCAALVSPFTRLPLIAFVSDLTPSGAPATDSARGHDKRAGHTSSDASSCTIISSMRWCTATNACSVTSSQALLWGVETAAFAAIGQRCWTR